MSEQTKIAVAVIPGIGKRDEDDYQEIAVKPLQEHFAKEIGEGNAVVELINWTSILKEQQNDLYDTFEQVDARLDYSLIRYFLVRLITSIIGYQPDADESHTYYDIHAVLAKGFNSLANKAGPKAPLVIIAHSMGAVIASNYLRELQNGSTLTDILEEKDYDHIEETPLEKGETLTQFYMLGTLIALYSVRHRNFDQPMDVPAPALREHYPQEQYPDIPSQWFNFYDRDDIFAYPLGQLNKAYGEQVEDRQVNVGGLLESWNPLSHLEYWQDKSVIDPVIEGVVKHYKSVNK